MTWSARGYRSIIDYILTNKKLSPLVNDTKVFRGYDVTTDHYLLFSKIRLPHCMGLPTNNYKRQRITKGHIGTKLLIPINRNANILAYRRQ